MNQSALQQAVRAFMSGASEDAMRVLDEIFSSTGVKRPITKMSNSPKLPVNAKQLANPQQPGAEDLSPTQQALFGFSFQPGPKGLEGFSAALKNFGQRVLQKDLSPSIPQITNKPNLGAGNLNVADRTNIAGFNQDVSKLQLGKPSQKGFLSGSKMSPMYSSQDLFDSLKDQDGY